MVAGQFELWFCRIAGVDTCPSVGESVGILVGVVGDSVGISVGIVGESWGIRSLGR